MYCLKNEESHEKCITAFSILSYLAIFRQIIHISIYYLYLFICYNISVSQKVIIKKFDLVFSCVLIFWSPEFIFFSWNHWAVHWFCWGCMGRIFRKFRLKALLVENVCFLFYGRSRSLGTTGSWQICIMPCYTFMLLPTNNRICIQIGFSLK